MKNIHILPTDKPSRLYLFEERLILGDLVTVVFKKSGAVNQYIYITNDEEIKKGDFIIVNEGILYFYNPHQIKTNIDIPSISILRENDKKVILTTDQDLIENGVQAIDDEFLEWFVNNPSCESVEVERFHGIITSIAEVNAISGDGSLNWEGKSDLRDYKIIIPKEEPKQETLEEVSPMQELIILLDKIKKNLTNKNEVITIQLIIDTVKNQFVDKELKWQQEQDKKLYSEEDVKQAFLDGMFYSSGDTVDNAIKEWFEQFKNK
jgi:hypothetical protein